MRAERRRWQLCAGLPLLGVLLFLAHGARAQSVRAFENIQPIDSAPAGIVTGPDGALWFTDGYNGRVDRMTTGGSVTGFQLPGFVPAPLQIVVGPDGALWFAQRDGQVGRITTTGELTEYSVPSAGAQIFTIAAGTDGALWYSGVTDGGSLTKVGRLTTDGVFTQFPLPWPYAAIYAMTVGPDGQIWFTDNYSDIVARVTPDGTISGFQLPSGRAPAGIVTGPDGALWFTEEAGAIGRLTVDGTFAEYVVPTPNAAPDRIAKGPDGALWFTEWAVPAVGRIAMDGSITETPLAPPGTSDAYDITAGPDGALWVTSDYSTIYRVSTTNSPGPVPGPVSLEAAVLPSSRSMMSGNTVTAFASIINSGTGTATGCKIVPTTSVPVSFDFYITDPATNYPLGFPNIPVDIPGGGTQSFLLSFIDSSAFVPTDVSFGFSCTNSDPAPVMSGVNTLLLSASETPTADMVALSATVSGDGIVNIPGETGIGVFAVASINLGSGSTLAVSADTGQASLPVSVKLCQTDPATAQCLASQAANFGTTIAANATPTFSVFVTGTGQVPFLPGTNRIFVRFRDAQGNIRGSTSVAVRTQ